MALTLNDVNAQVVMQFQFNGNHAADGFMSDETLKNTEPYAEQLKDLIICIMILKDGKKIVGSSENSLGLIAYDDALRQAAKHMVLNSLSQRG